MAKPTNIVVVKQGGNTPVEPGDRTWFLASDPGVYASRIWSDEFPDAFLFTGIRAAKKYAKECKAVAVTDYGLESEVRHA